MGRMEVGTAGKGRGRGNKGGRRRMDTLILDVTTRKTTPRIEGKQREKGKDWGRCMEGKDMQHGPYSENLCVGLPRRNTGVGPT